MVADHDQHHVTANYLCPSDITSYNKWLLHFNKFSLWHDFMCFSLTCSPFPFKGFHVVLFIREDRDFTR